MPRKMQAGAFLGESGPLKSWKYCRRPAVLSPEEWTARPKVRCMWRPAGRPVQDLQLPPRESQQEEWSQNPADVRLELGGVKAPPETGREVRLPGRVAGR